MGKLVIPIIVLVIVAVVALLLRPGVYIKDGIHACGVVIGANETVSNIKNQTCYCMGSVTVAKSETADQGQRSYCQGFGISLSR